MVNFSCSGSVHTIGQPHWRGHAWLASLLQRARSLGVRAVWISCAWIFAVWCASAGLAQAQSADNTLLMASTTSTEQSGLFAHLLPAFKKATGIDTKVVALGTGQALDMGRRGDADVVFVHDAAAEAQFVAQGHGIKRWPVMYNDFVIVGPQADPARIRGLTTAQALRALAKAQVTFVSRGDQSGTHAAELRLWDAAQSKPGAAFYKACGCGMGPALNMAASMGAYLLTDRGTWLAFKNRQDLDVLVEGDKMLFNQYGVIAVNPQKHPNVRLAQAQKFIDWVTSAPGQQTIADYKIQGKAVFYPNANSQAAP